MSSEPLERLPFQARGSHANLGVTSWEFRRQLLARDQSYGTVVQAGCDKAVRGATVKYVVIGFLLIFLPGLLVGWLLLH
jgi:hypothetical protein